jgi:hypothetical protein
LRVQVLGDVTLVNGYFLTFQKVMLPLGQGNSVGIATRYGLDGPGIEFRWDEIFRTCPDRPWGPPSLLYNGYRAIPVGKAAGPWR